ncbi:MAG: hypothetical protein J5696_07465 [Lachnospiraceae bacterium]|nr:hypothetical protein [Lachnospiraceae bacterium]
MSEWIMGNDLKLHKNFWIIMKGLQSEHFLQLWTDYIDNSHFVLHIHNVIAYREVDFYEVAESAALFLDKPIVFQNNDGKFLQVNVSESQT